MLLAPLWILLHATGLALDPQSQAAELRLELDRPIEGRIVDGDPLVTTPTLVKSYTDAPVVGTAFVFEAPSAGSFTIELKSHFFDAYLVVRDDAQTAVGENDDGPIGTHALVVLKSLRAHQLVRVEACALHGGRGAFTLVARAGAPKAPDPRELRKLLLADAEEKLRAVEARGDTDTMDLVEACLQLGRLRRDMHEFAAAELHLARALSIGEVVLGPSHPNLATLMNELALSFMMRGEPAKALPLLERARGIYEQAYGPEHASVAAALNNLAGAMRDTGDLAGARPLLERVLELRIKIQGAEHPDVGQALNNLGELLEDLREYDEAERLIRHALAIHTKARGPLHVDVATDLNNLSMLLKREGRYADALAYSRQALEITEQMLGPENPDTLRAARTLGDMLIKVGSFSEARPLYERGLRVYEKIEGGRNLHVAQYLGALALIAHFQGNDAEARPLYERALKIRESLQGLDHPEVASLLNNFGVVVILEGRLEEARAMLDRALAIRQQKLPADDPALGESLNNLGAVLYEQRRLEQARDFFERALVLRDRALPKGHPDVAQTLNNLAETLREQGRLAEALTCYERCIAINEATLPLEHPDRILGSSAIALLYLDGGQAERARKQLLELLDRSRGRTESLFQSASEAERFILLTQSADIVARLISVTRKEPSAEAVLQGYERIAAWKDATTRSGILSRERLRGNMTPAQVQVLDDLRQVQRQLSDELYRSDIPDRAAQEQALAALRERRGSLERELVRAAGGDPQAAKLDVQALARALPADAAWIDFMVHPVYLPAKREGEKVVEAGHWGGERVSAWVLQPGSAALAYVDLGEALVLGAAVQDYLSTLKREHLTARGKPVTAKRDGPTPGAIAGAKLRALLWDPLAAHLKSARQLFVSPDRFLGALPLETLPLASGKFLIEECSLVYVPDAPTLLRLLRSDAPARRAESSPGQALVVGGIDYDQREARAAEEGSVALAQATLRGDFRGHWGLLRYTSAEARSVADMRAAVLKRAKPSGSAPEDATLEFAGGAATEEQLKKALQKTRYIHLATHGFFNPEGLPSLAESAEKLGEARHASTLLSELGVQRGVSEANRITGLMPGLLTGLVCAGANLPPDPTRDNGLLTAEEITWLDLSEADLVVLSACETGLGKDRGGHGVASLRSAFQLAGAKTVIASLWSVDDESTSELMRGFYQRLWLDGEPMSAALRKAQLELLARNRAANQGDGLPWTWGAFTLSGEWR